MTARPEGLSSNRMQLVETAIDPYLAEAAYVLGEHAGSSIDLITRNIISSGTNLRFAGGVASRGAVTASSIANSTELRKVLRQLKKANARPFPELNGKFAGITHPIHLGRSRAISDGKAG